MANKNIHIDITASNKTSGAFNQAKNDASSMSASIMASLDTTSIHFTEAIKRYNNSMHSVNRVATRVARIAGDSIYNFTKDAINNFSELEKQHAKTMGAMATDYEKTAEAQAKFLRDSEKLKQQALQIGTYGANNKGALHTVTDVSYAQTALVKSGLSADDILKSNAVQSILKFAGGNDLDIDTATTFAVNLGTVFDKSVDQWGEMLDMITKAADISVIDVEDIMDSLTYTGGIASGLGRNLEEVLGVISIMGNAGLRGRVAGTGLQAFFTRILSAGELSDTQIGSAPTEYVGQLYNAFTAEAVNADGSFKSMDEVASLLDTAMESLNDQEQAWFAKKLFGLYQMKAAYAVTGAVDGDTNLITDFIEQITNQSAGSNDMKYELMQGSQYGKIQSLKNAWEGIKTDIGDRLSPVVSATADELLTFLNNNGNYKFNWTKLREAMQESGELISEKYGAALGQAVENIGNLGIDGAQIAGAMLPYVGGVINGFTLLLQGDIIGAMESFNKGLSDTNEEIDDLPPELRGSAEAARNVIVMFTNLATLNVATKIAQLIANVVKGGYKVLKWITPATTMTSTNTTVASTNAVLNGNYIQVNTGSGSVDIGQVPLMNVTATVVNVYGGGSGLPGTGTGGNPTSPTTPMLNPPSGVWFFPQLWGAGNSTSTPTLSLPSGSPTLSLPGNSVSTPTLMPPVTSGGGTGSDIVMYKVGSQYLTKSQILASAAKTLGLVAVLAGISTIPSSGIDPEIRYADILQEGIDGGYDNEELRDYLYNNFKDLDDIYTKDWAVKRYDDQTGLYKKFLNPVNATNILGSIKSELNNEGELSEDFLLGLVRNGTYWGGKDDVKFLLSTLFNGEYDEPWFYWGSLPDESITDFVKDAIKNDDIKHENILTSDAYEAAFDSNSVMGRFFNTVNGNNTDTSNASKYDFSNLQLVDLSKFNSQPVVNVNVTTNVDKSGIATTKVDIDNISRSVARRGAQYGQTVMDR